MTLYSVIAIILEIFNFTKASHVDTTILHMSTFDTCLLMNAVTANKGLYIYMY